MALGRTTHLAIGAHPDDIELIAYHGVAACFERTDLWFTGFGLANGMWGIPGADDVTDPALMVEIRAEEQRKAAVIGGYSAIAQLDRDSAELSADAARVESALVQLIELARPDTVYVHSPFDRHPSHVAACLRSVGALRATRDGAKPARVFGVEVWGSLDWFPERVSLDVSPRPELRDALLGVYESQIRGGKPFPAGQAARGLANAVFDSPEVLPAHARRDAVAFAVDLTPLIRDSSRSVDAFVEAHLESFSRETLARLRP